MIRAFLKEVVGLVKERTYTGFGPGDGLLPKAYTKQSDQGLRVHMQVPLGPSKTYRASIRLPQTPTEVAQELELAWTNAKFGPIMYSDVEYNYEYSDYSPPAGDVAPESIAYRNATLALLDSFQSDFDLPRYQAYVLFSKLFPDGVLPEAENGSLVQEAMTLAHQRMKDTSFSKQVRGASIPDPPTPPSTPLGRSFGRDK